jgi:hypothetical protein
MQQDILGSKGFGSSGHELLRRDCAQTIRAGIFEYDELKKLTI